MGLGIGANNAMLSIVSPILLRPLPFEEPERLVWITNTGDGIGLSGVTSRASNLRDWRRMNESFEGLTGLLASLGIYGVLSYAVSQRTKEIGIRMALGASAREVRAHVVARTLALTGVGIAIGWLGSFVVSRAIASLLFGVQPSDPLTFALMTAVLVLIAGLAAYVPARRASRIDPMSVLRLA